MRNHMTSSTYISSTHKSSRSSRSYTSEIDCIKHLRTLVKMWIPYKNENFEISKTKMFKIMIQKLKI